MEIKVGRQEGRTLPSYWPSCGHRKSGTRGRWMTWNASFTTLTTNGSTSCRFTSYSVLRSNSYHSLIKYHTKDLIILLQSIIARRCFDYININWEVKSNTLHLIFKRTFIYFHTIDLCIEISITSEIFMMQVWIQLSFHSIQIQFIIH